MKIVVLERESVGTDISVEGFKKYGETVFYANTVGIEQTKERIIDADIVVCNKAPMNENTLKTAKKVKLICLFATGYDNVDVDYCKANGIEVRNVKAYCTDMVAQHTFTLALALTEKLVHYDNYVKSGEYQKSTRFSNFDIPIYELNGKTWGIVGFGNIGQRVSTIAKAFGLNVLVYSFTGKKNYDGVKFVTKEELLKNSDYISLHCPLTKESINFIDNEDFEHMKPTAILINVARGKVVNNTALYEALINKKISAAGLDVLEDEPIKESNPLSKIKDSNRLIITPHLAWASVEARNRCVEATYKNIEEFLSSK